MYVYWVRGGEKQRADASVCPLHRTINLRVKNKGECSRIVY